MKCIIKKGIGSYTEKNSKFISICFSIADLEDFWKKLKEIKETYKNATHYTYALRIVTKNGTLLEKFSDNKEPFGTAGLPMLNLLKIDTIVNSAIITVRYFGGVKLGKSNLLKAYLNTANMALKDALIKELVEKIELSIEFPYSFYEKVSYILNEKMVEITDKRFSELVSIDFKVSKDLSDSIISELKIFYPEIKIYLNKVKA